MVGMDDELEKRIEDINGVLIELQAEISALKNLMFENNPKLGQEFQRRVDELVVEFRKARKDQNQRS
jgi:hypothetical protein